MRDATGGSLATLASQDAPALGRAEGTVRIELERAGKVERWYLDARGGKVGVSRKRRPYDCTVRATAELFDGMVRGEANAMTALLRGELQVDGDAELLVLLQRLFPSPPRSLGAEGRTPARKGARR